MSKYFKEKEETKIKLEEHYELIKDEYEKLTLELERLIESDSKQEVDYSLVYDLERKQKELRLPYLQSRHIYKALGDVELSSEMLKTLSETLDSTTCRYGTVCLLEKNIVALYDIMTFFPMLSSEAILCIGREYIDDLFEKYDLLKKLREILKEEGFKDSAFEHFMEYVKEKAIELEKHYEWEAAKIEVPFGHYSYKFVKHYQDFIKKHHISYRKFIESMPERELFVEDELQLHKISLSYRDCWGICEPISYEMFDSYLDGDQELANFEEQPFYSITHMREKIPTTFTKTSFLESIKSRQKQFVKKI